MARRHAGLPSWRSEVRRVLPGASQPRANRHLPGRNGRRVAAPDEWNFRSRCRTRGRFAPGLGFVSTSLRGSPLAPSHTWTRPPVAPESDRWMAPSVRSFPEAGAAWPRILAVRSRRPTWGLQRSNAPSWNPPRGRRRRGAGAGVNASAPRGIHRRGPRARAANVVCGPGRPRHDPRRR